MRLKRSVVRGPALERGRQHGEELSDLVRETWRFYRDVVFPKPPFDLQACGEAYRDAISGFGAEYGEELRGIAEGSGLAP